MGFLCPLLVRTLPWITCVPGVLRTRGGIKAVVGEVAGRVVEEHKKIYGDFSHGRRRHKTPGPMEGKDILSVLMRSRKKGKGGQAGCRETMSDEQILDNVCVFFVCSGDEAEES
jgi:hypothetical protein